MSLTYQPPKGKTGLYSAVEEAMRALGDAEFGDTIYLVTDEGENLSAISQRRLVQDLITDGIRTFVFLVNTSDTKTPEEREGPRTWRNFAGQTGANQVRQTQTQTSLAPKHFAVAYPYGLEPCTTKSQT
jgi:hypothetical protein